MSVQEDLTHRQHGQDGWMGRIRGAMAGDEKPEPFQFIPQVFPTQITLMRSHW
jgi:hypothetical protein